MKIRKQLKDRERDVKSLREQVNILKIKNEELLNKVDDHGKRGLSAHHTSNKPQVSSSVPSTVINHNSNSNNNNDAEIKRLR